jgi:hypothetical protein
MPPTPAFAVINAGLIDRPRADRLFKSRQSSRGDWAWVHGLISIRHNF